MGSASRAHSEVANPIGRHVSNGKERRRQAATATLRTGLNLYSKAARSLRLFGVYREVPQAKAKRRVEARKESLAAWVARTCDKTRCH